LILPVAPVWSMVFASMPQGVMRMNQRTSPTARGTWTDEPIDEPVEDRFDLQDCAQVLAERAAPVASDSRPVQAARADTPLIIGLFGRWGSGKTSLMKLIDAKLLEPRPTGRSVHSIWINTWQLSNQDEVWQAFLQALFNQVNDGLSWSQKIDKRKLGRQIFINLYRVVLVSIPLVVGFIVGKPDAGWSDVASFVFSAAGVGTALTVGLGWWAILKPFVESWRKVVNFDVKAALKYEPFEAQVTELTKLSKRFKEMVEALVGKNGRLVVFVDDLDRCAPDKIPDILEAIKLFATVRGCVYVLGFDRDIVRQGLEKKYQFKTPTEADEYLEKLIQIPFHLPPLEYDRVRAFIERDYEELKKDCPNAAKIFSLGLEPNPRKIKRALGIYRTLVELADLRWKMWEMDYRVEPEVLAKIVVIQSRFRDLFEVLAYAPYNLLGSVVWAQHASDADWYDKAKPTIEFQTWLKTRVRDPEMAKRVREGSMSLKDLRRDNFDIDSALEKTLTLHESEVDITALKQEQLDACIYLTGPIERSVAEKFRPNRKDRVVLLGGDETEIKNLVDDIKQRGETKEDRDKAKQVYIDRLNGVLSDLKRYTPAERVSANVALDALDNWLFPEFAPVTVRIPAGKFWMGSGDEQLEVVVTMSDHLALPGEKPTLSSKRYFAEVVLDDECPPHEVELSKYRIGKFPVTKREYQAFVKATQHTPPYFWNGQEYPRGEEKHPVIDVSWDDAQAYCDWLTEAARQWAKEHYDWHWNSYKYRLPTEAEWEKAARGIDRRVYPWGDTWDPKRLNCSKGRPKGDRGATTPVDQFSPQGDSPYGIADMAGNVFEWCLDWYDKEEYKNRQGRNAKDPYGPPNGEYHVKRSAAFTIDDRVECRSANRSEIPFGDCGFRVVLAVDTAERDRILQEAMQRHRHAEEAKDQAGLTSESDAN
jgi:formylglycine-generating enzyme required for sulfatase activity